jgi:hypothetical protein
VTWLFSVAFGDSLWWTIGCTPATASAADLAALVGIVAVAVAVAVVLVEPTVCRRRRRTRGRPAAPVN